MSKKFITYVGDTFRLATAPNPVTLWFLNTVNKAAVKSGSPIVRDVAATTSNIINLPQAGISRLNAAITRKIPAWTEEKAEGDLRNTWTIDKSNHLARYYDNDGKLAIVSVAGTGLIKGDKSEEGDNKTPNGKYKLGSPEDGSSKKGGTMSYGKHFYRTNHKNSNGTSSGVGLHGTGLPFFNGMNVSHGCIRLDNGAVECFHDTAPNKGAGSNIIIYEKKGGNIPKFWKGNNIGTKKVEDLTDEEYKELERMGAFGNPLNQMIITKDHNIIDYSDPLDMSNLTNNTEQLRKWYTAENARKMKKAFPVVTAALASPALLYGGATAAASGNLVPTIGNGILQVIRAITPSSYVGIFGEGAYNTALGAKGASTAGAIADGALASLYGTLAVLNFQNNPNLRSAAEVGLALNPLIMTQNLSRLDRARAQLSDAEEVILGPKNILQRTRQLLGENSARAEQVIEDYVRHNPNDFSVRFGPNNRPQYIVANRRAWRLFEDHLLGLNPANRGTQGAVLRPFTQETQAVPPTLRTRGKNEAPYKLEEIIDEAGNLKPNNFASTHPGGHGFEYFYRLDDTPEEKADKYFKLMFKGSNFGDIKEIYAENDLDRSGVLTKYKEGDFSYDSFETALKYLRLALAKGKNFYKNPNVEKQFYRANNLGLKNRYISNLTPELVEVLKLNKGLPRDQYHILEFSKNDPEGVRKGLKIVDLNGKVMGELLERTPKEIVELYKPLIDKLNKLFESRGYKFTVDYPQTTDQYSSGVLWPNIEGVIYKKGGKFYKKS